MFTSAVIVAAGKGLRMGTTIPKQYLELKGRPVLAHTLMAFANSRVDEIVVVCPKGDVDYVSGEIVEKLNIKKPVNIIEGGNERFDSSYLGIHAASPRAEKILIHDGVRALVTPELINRVIDALDCFNAVCPAITVKDTIRLVDNDGVSVKVINRNELRAIQTPQGFLAGTINEAYAKYYMDPIAGVTDDAMIVEEYMKERVKLIEGANENIKITTSEDLKIAESFL